MGVVEQARALAAELGRSQELQNYKAAQQQVIADQAAIKLLNKYMEMEQELMLTQMQVQQVPEADVNNLKSYRQQISANQVVAKFFAAKDSFEQLWYQINQIIGSVIG
jgi:cell fate (sporulation/competence/biofilm development) regulator YlbF (YheA/YmcA/DUF963 family)